MWTELEPRGTTSAMNYLFVLLGLTQINSIISRQQNADLLLEFAAF